MIEVSKDTLYVRGEDGTFHPVNVFGTGGGAYVLPTASADTLGGVKVGDGLQMDGDVLGVVPEGEYELLEAINVTEEGLRSIERDREPNGKEYSIKKLFILVAAPKAVSSGFFYTIINDKLFAPLTGTLDASFDKGTIGQVKAVVENGLLDGYGVGAKNQGTSNTLYKYVTNECIPSKIVAISSVGIMSTVDMPVGTTIKIWGIRANA